MIKGNKLYLTDYALNITRDVLNELVVLTDDKITKTIYKAAIYQIDQIKRLPKQPTKPSKEKK